MHCALPSSSLLMRRAGCARCSTLRWCHVHQQLPPLSACHVHRVHTRARRGVAPPLLGHLLCSSVGQVGHGFLALVRLGLEAQLASEGKLTRTWIPGSTHFVSLLPKVVYCSAQCCPGLPGMCMTGISGVGWPCRKEKIRSRMQLASWERLKPQAPSIPPTWAWLRSQFPNPGPL